MDALSFADALRTDGHAWRWLKPQDPRIQELRLLCRDEIELIGQRTAFVNQLREALKEYYPAALEAFDDWTLPSPWEFVQQFPTPQALDKAGKRRWEKFLHTHRLYDLSYSIIRTCLIPTAYVNSLNINYELLLREYLGANNLKILTKFIFELLRLIFRRKQDIVMENLAYPNERIVDTDLNHLTGMEGFGLCVMIIKGEGE